LALREGHFEFSHRVINGELVFSGGFQAEANGGESRGSAKLDLAWNYRDETLKFNAQINSLSLPWLVQMTSARLAENLRSGGLLADLEAERKARASRLDVRGLFTVEDATIFVAPLADKPVDNLSASYYFGGFYHPHAAVPEPRLLRTPAIAANAPAPPNPKDDEQALKKDPGDKSGDKAAQNSDETTLSAPQQG